MKPRRIKTAILLAVALFIHLFSRDPQWVESYYATSFYASLSSFQRFVTGWVPFSIGDLVYLIVLIWFGWKLVTRLGSWRRDYSGFTLKGSLGKGFSYLNTLLIIYILFNVVWGINYNRLPVSKNLGLVQEKFTLAELEEVSCVLIDKVNRYRSAIPATYPSSKELYKKVYDAYDSAARVYPFLKIEPSSAKPSIFGVIGSYVGFTGYYNPFTGEAQVCMQFPKFLLPYTACHEVAHQLGYARENEANFVGYLAASSSDDPLLKYSVYLDLFIYANRSLNRADSVLARIHRNSLGEDVHEHLEEWSEFSRRHRNPVEPYFRWLYGKFLQQNQQPRGMMTYDEVTGFILALYKQKGDL